jgi:predicted nucleic acid-binding protein
MPPPSPLPSIPSGQEILIDANVLVYGLSNFSRECAGLLERCALRDVNGFTTVEALAEACHKLMLTDAHRRGLINKANASALQGKVSVVQQLSDYWRRLTSLINVAVLPLDEFRFQRAHSLRLRFGLLTNDSILLAAADVFGLSALATNDTDFDLVPWLTVYKPTDIP